MLEIPSHFPFNQSPIVLPFLSKSLFLINPNILKWSTSSRVGNIHHKSPPFITYNFKRSNWLDPIYSNISK